MPGNALLAMTNRATADGRLGLTTTLAVSPALLTQDKLALARLGVVQHHEQPVAEV